MIEEEYVDILHMREHEYPRDTADNYGALPSKGSTEAESLAWWPPRSHGKSLLYGGKLDP